MTVVEENTSYAYQRFKEIREKSGLSEYQVSQKSDGKISTSVLTQWSRGDYDLKLDKLQVLAKVFNVPITYFIE